MVFLPLLYPEVFARFRVAPPRGVLLHGPPGTGKTLIARALAASCSRAGAQVSFFMRKGADVLSKWVGESERQLRLLFTEAQRYGGLYVARDFQETVTVAFTAPHLLWV